MRHYPPAERAGSQLTLVQRYGIYIMRKNGFSQTEIADELDVHKSTISRELRRNQGGRGYRYKQAHTQATDRRRSKRKPHINSGMWEFIDVLIKNDWSPEQIHGWLKEKLDVAISHEWIYQHIYQDQLNGGTLYTHLRSQKSYRKRRGGHDRRGQIKNRVSIEERPDIVETKERIGDWEVDTIIGKGHKQAIVSLTERKSKLALIYKVERRTKENVTDAVTKMLTPIKDTVLTMTSDNGKEFAGHEKISKNLNVDFYFAHPYASYERGLNENTNGLIRQYFPKNRDFRTITDDEIDMATKKLNNRPRKRLGYKTPNEVFFGMELTVALNT